jgi:hypothetical protein
MAKKKEAKIIVKEINVKFKVTVAFAGFRRGQTIKTPRTKAAEWVAKGRGEIVK